MHRPETPDPTNRVARLARELSLQPRLEAEVLRARRQFFGNDAEVAGATDRAREHRFAEWFLLERESEVLGAVPVDVPPFVAHSGDLRDSLAGAFLVQSDGAVTTVLDLQDDEVLELAVEPGMLAAGDLLVGRLFPTPGERWQPSAAAPVLRQGRDVATAFARDIERLELGRRLQQIELEHLLLQQARKGPAFAAAMPPAEALRPLEHLEADLEQLLQATGGKHSAAFLSEQLAEAERPGTLIGPLLDQLAFHTDVDLERAQRLLLEIWNAHHEEHEAPAPAPSPAPSPSLPPGLSLGEQLVRTLEEGLAQHRDVEELFRQIEQMAGIDGDDDDDDDEGLSEDALGQLVSAADHDLQEEEDAGDLGPLVTEYLWESRQDGTPAASTLSLWIELQRNASVQRTDVEAVESGDLMRLLLHVYLRSAPDERAPLVRETFAQLQRFYEWVHEVHEIDCRAVLQQCRGALLDDLERLSQASQLLSSAQRPTRPPGILEIEDLAGDGFGVSDDDGGHHWLSAGRDALAALRVGDLVLGGISVDGDARRLGGLVVVLPRDARALIE
ncbi:MAG: hypothetical protein H6835_13090 [Planctomycetes bacterium]|nr:hypothetical protein [Planctomycetota bacterium]